MSTDPTPATAATWWRRFWYRHAKIASQADVDKIEGQVREEIAGYFDRLSGNRNPDDPEGSAAYSRWAMNAADRIRHPERYEGCAANAD